MSAPASGEVDQLLIAISRGDRRAFAELYQGTGPQLFGICRRLMRRRDLAEDVLQEAFVRIWQKAFLFDPSKGEAMPWLATLVRRCALDRLRQQGDPAGAPEGGGFELAESMLTAMPRDPGRDLQRCLGELQSGQQKAILLAYVHGLTHGELARHLAAPLGTVKSWIRRGLSELKECLER